MDTVADLDKLTEKIIGCAIEVHRTMGPGLLESVYRQCLAIELAEAHLNVDCARRVPIVYKGHRISAHLEIDMVVGDRVVVELKAVDALHPVYSAQVITYLKLSGCPAGLLINFNATSVRAGLKRLSRPDVYAARTDARANQKGKTS
jgi:GxxExxY protein